MIVDVNGTARMFDVKPSTVHQWRRRRLLPEPAGYVSGSPYWDWHALRAWGHETGRTIATGLRHPNQPQAPQRASE